jgi:predicted nucleic acid-binding protein
VIVVVDRSVRIALLHNRDPPKVRRLRAIAAPDGIVVGDLILPELLRGARDEAHAARIERDLRQFPIEPMPGEALAIRAAAHARALRRHGVRLRRTIGLVIATFCLDRGNALLQADRDFVPMAPHLGLRLA